MSLTPLGRDRLPNSICPNNRTTKNSYNMLPFIHWVQVSVTFFASSPINIKLSLEIKQS